jgi:hypothetical protein
MVGHAAFLAVYDAWLLCTTITLCSSSYHRFFSASVLTSPSVDLVPKAISVFLLWVSGSTLFQILMVLNQPSPLPNLQGPHTTASLTPPLAFPAGN